MKWISEFLQGAGGANCSAISSIGTNENANLAGGFDISSYDIAKDRNSKIVERMNNANSPMPPSGLLNPTERKLVEKWVSLGSPQ